MSITDRVHIPELRYLVRQCTIIIEVSLIVLQNDDQLNIQLQGPQCFNARLATFILTDWLLENERKVTYILLHFRYLMYSFTPMLPRQLCVKLKLINLRTKNRYLPPGPWPHREIRGWLP